MYGQWRNGRSYWSRCEISAVHLNCIAVAWKTKACYYIERVKVEKKYAKICVKKDNRKGLKECGRGIQVCLRMNSTCNKNASVWLEANRILQSASHRQGICRCMGVFDDFAACFWSISQITVRHELTDLVHAIVAFRLKHYREPNFFQILKKWCCKSGQYPFHTALVYS
jgi:hypothetical protein